MPGPAARPASTTCCAAWPTEGGCAGGSGAVRDLPASVRHPVGADAVRPALDPAAPRAVAALADAGAAFGGHQAPLRFLTCQDEAIARTCDCRWASTRIALPVDLDSLQPLRLERELQCPRLQAMALASGLAFRLPRVPFRVVSERLL
ncbi:hypothetical protein BN1263180071 [Stenotrophomonas maltophilia]|nr:hypothetical protein BN1263180071 [Stenotrophomonas maltophilia]